MCTRSFIDCFFLSFFVHILSNDKKKKKQINFNLHVPLGKLAENKIKNWNFSYRLFLFHWQAPRKLKLIILLQKYPPFFCFWYKLDNSCPCEYHSTSIHGQVSGLTSQVAAIWFFFFWVDSVNFAIHAQWIAVSWQASCIADAGIQKESAINLLFFFSAHRSLFLYVGPRIHIDG